MPANCVFSWSFTLLYNFLNPSPKSEQITFDPRHGFALSLSHQHGFAADKPGLCIQTAAGNFAP
jgi:hypothetical protein